ncbi:hypothetical protein BDW62DRAFT_94785 [Aspergillus aurantiobrunneus]
MVVNTPASGPGGVKRTLSSVQDGCAGWETTSPMGAPLRPPVNLPFAHYALIYYDNMGKIKVSESPSIQEQNRSVFTPDVREKFLEIIGPKIGYYKPLMHRTSAVPHAYNNAQDTAYHRHGKRRKASAHSSALGVSFSEHLPEPIPQIPSPSTNNMVALQIGDTEKVLEYYETALKHFQQINCRQIAKAFIKFIEPGKQVKHPYNGRPKAGAPTGDPEKTKPEWWPAGVKHKEPDHLKKDARLRLLIHILRKLGPFNITLDKLHGIAQDNKRQFRPEETMDEKMEILNEIFRVRRLEELFENGEVDAETMVYIRNRSAPAKDTKDNESMVSDTEPKLEADDLEDVEEIPLTSASSSEHLPSFTAVDPLALQTRSFSMTNDRSQTFPMNETLNFGEPSRQGRSYFPTSAEYADDYSSHSMLRPVASGLVSPNEHPGAFDYLSHQPFTASAASEHHRPLTMPMQQVSHFDTWNSPFRPNLYNPMEYGASETLAQSPMPYPMSMNLSNTHGMPIDLGRERQSHMDILSGRSSVNKSF